MGMLLKHFDKAMPRLSQFAILRKSEAFGATPRFPGWWSHCSICD
jgi:hypothetical protein